MANALLNLNYLQSRIEATQKDDIFHTKQCQTFYRKMKCDLLNFRGVKSGYHLDFQYLMVIYLINCNHEQKIFSVFLMERPYYIVRHTIMLSWEMPSKNVFCLFCFDNVTLKGSTSQFFNFSAQSQNFTGSSNGPDLS